MLRRRFLAARARYRCEWKCTHCGKCRREQSEIGASDRVAINPFTDNLPDEVSLSGEVAQEKARKRFFLLQERVNQRRWLRGLRVSGVCRRCGRRQFWAPALRHAWAVTLAAACFAALVWASGLPGGKAAWLGYLAAGAGTALAMEYISLHVTRWRLNRLPDQDCAPWLEELFPED